MRKTIFTFIIVTCLFGIKAQENADSISLEEDDIDII